ncbi:glycosyltransferase family 2 protein [Aspergillus mulundensis]|uniref:Putative cellulose synthase n=1 Tax=Aspergillus mulundensis TaxID=1810919 RepID=A0A3D8R4V7_9EURO|nr:putative cellulose synthase [Aspergillus mulundensis]RDW68844.1 putative cellulose synthase [Aspergillus mulundensis]
MLKEPKGVDVVELPPHQHVQDGKRYREPLIYAAHAARWLSNIYFLTRLGLLGAVQQSWHLWLMIIVEWILAHGFRQNYLSTIAAGNKAKSPRARLRLRGNSQDLPRVDIFVATCGEPLDVVLDTIRAACTLDYPASRFRVLVLDDGGSVMLKGAVEELTLTSYPNLSYNTRTSASSANEKGQVFAKSANLNYALFTLQEDPAFQPQAGYCAVLDADCMPSPDFLRGTIPHLLLNPQAALVTTRQYYYNLPRDDPLSQSRLHFYACQNAELDSRNRAIDAGSGALFRRQAIVDVGGYPTYSFSEDWQLSLILRAKGHQVLQVEEPLQWGTVPGSLKGHIAQRNRWNIGHAQQIKLLLPWVRGELEMEGRLGWDIGMNGVGIVGGLVGCLFVQWAAPVLLLALGLGLGQGRSVVPVSADARWVNTLQLSLAIAHIASIWLYGWLQMAATGFRVSLFPHLENIWLAGQHLLAIIKFYCVTSKPKEGSFVTGSTANSWNQNQNQKEDAVGEPIPAPDSSVSSCQTFLRRDLLAHGAVLTTILWLLITASAIVLCISRSWRGSYRYDERADILSLKGIFYPSFVHVLYLVITNAWVAVSCLVNPPVYPDRDERLEETKEGTRFPRLHVRKEVVGSTFGRPVYSAIAGAAMFLLCGALVAVVLL